MSEFLSHRLRRGDMTLGEKLWQVSWSLVFFVSLIAGVGFLMLYSAANGAWDPWASRQMARYGVGLGPCCCWPWWMSAN